MKQVHRNHLTTLHYFVVSLAFPVTASAAVRRDLLVAAVYLCLIFGCFLGQFVEVLLGVRACLRTGPCADMLVDLVPVLAVELERLEELGVLLVRPPSRLCPLVPLTGR
jgi:hypothetical protein